MLCGRSYKAGIRNGCWPLFLFFDEMNLLVTIVAPVGILMEKLSEAGSFVGLIVVPVETKFRSYVIRTTMGTNVHLIIPENVTHASMIP